jgi:hypothetical protein
VQIVIGQLRSDWNVEDVNAIKASIPCQVQILINDVTIPVLLDLLADPPSNWIEVSI